MKKLTLAVFCVFLSLKCAFATECVVDEDCAFDEECVDGGTIDSKCRILTCPDDRPPESHACRCPAGMISNDKDCFKPKCMADTDCPDGFVCIGGGSMAAECAALNCSSEEKAVGHVCIPKLCAEFDERYTPVCPEGTKAVFAQEEGADGACYICQQEEKSCESDEDCPDAESCEEERCAPVLCPHCFTAEKHECARRKDCCLTDADCPAGEKCAQNKCVKKICPEINLSYVAACGAGNVSLPVFDKGGEHCRICAPRTCSGLNSSYKTSCGPNENRVSARKYGADGECFLCVQKKCAQINPSFRSKCGKHDIAHDTGEKGLDGNCFTCTRQMCMMIDMRYRAVCGKYDIAEKTGVIGAEGPCYICKLKTCAQIDPSYKTRCPAGKTAVAAGIAAEDGFCFICK